MRSRPRSVLNLAGIALFLHQTYAKYQYIKDAVEKLDCISQGETEVVIEYYRKLIMAARDLDRVFSPNELMNIF